MDNAYMDALGRYIQAFGQEPLQAYGLTDEAVTQLMLEALEAGEPIPEEAYERHLEDGEVS